MGLYVEPAGDKKAWFEANGTTWNTGSIPEGTLPVVMLPNPGFVALGVAYNKAELSRFLHSRPDGIWKVVSKALLRELVPEANKMKEFR